MSDISNRSYLDFVYPSPDYTQTGPFGYFVLVKLAIQAFGYSEYALRLVPLLSGIASLFLFYKIAKDLISPEAVPIALFLFAVLDPLVFYSSDLKPYSGDVAFALLIYAATTYIQSRNLNSYEVFLYSFIGVIAIWFSNSSVFILSGVGASLIIYCLTRKQWSRLSKLLIVFSIWLSAFIAYYYLYTQNIMANIGIGTKELLRLEHGLMPVPPKSFSDIKWFIDTFFDTFLFNEPIMFKDRVTLNGVMAFAFIVGCVAMFSRQREYFTILMFPILITLSAAALHLYPFKGRQILFIVPIFLLFIGEGAEYIKDKLSKDSFKVGIIFMVLLLFHPAAWASYRTIKPLSRSETRPVLSYINANWQDGDIIYVNFYAQYEFDYYLKYNNVLPRVREGDYVIGIAPRGWYKKWRKDRIPEIYKNNEKGDQSRDEMMHEYNMVCIKELNQIKGHKRAWVLFTGDISHEKTTVSHLQTIGKRIVSHGTSGSAITYLFDLNKQESETK